MGKPKFSNSDWALYKRLLLQARPLWPHYAGLLVLRFATTPLALLNPIPLKIAVDSVIGSHPLPSFIAFVTPNSMQRSEAGLLLVAAGLQIVIVLLSQLRNMLNAVYSTQVGERLKTGFRAVLLQHVQRLSVSYHDKRGSADSIYRIQYDAPAIQSFMQGLIGIFVSIVTLITLIAVVIAMDWQLSLIALAISPVLIVLTRTYKRKFRGRYKHLKELDSDALKIVQEILTSLRIVKVFGREEEEEERFVRKSQMGIQARTRLSLAESVYGLLINLATAVASATVLFIGILKVQRGDITLGNLLIIISYLTQLYDPLKNVSQLGANLQSSLASASRAFEILDHLPEVTEKPNAKTIKRAKGLIEFRNVSYSYELNEVLRNISFRIEPGTRAALVGRMGSGKTTLTHLLVRFFDPAAGQILLDGTDVRDYKLVSLRSQFGIVLQEPVLFSTTIAENIGYGRPDSRLDQIVSAAKAANAHDFIERLPDGYNTILGERGITLSGGQRQIVSIARAFLRDAPVMILDEPTSAVDVEAEAKILEAMERLMDGRTSILIAHRPTALKDREMYLFLEEGRLVSVSTELPEFMLQKFYDP